MSEFTAKLVASDGASIELSGEQTVGRSPDCDMVIDDGRVSREHARLRVQNSRLTVEDLGSANGTRVNETPAVGEVELADGDILCFEKHCYVVAISGGAAAMDATVVDMGATVVDAGATVVSAAPPADEAVNKEPPAAAVKADPPPAPQPAPSADAPVPGSWVDGPEEGHTRVLGLDELQRESPAGQAMGRASELAHLLLLSATGGEPELLELELSGGDSPDVWEIGREERCQILLDDSSVSKRHAQLSHSGGRWQLVNLVSANGIYVNGEKRLSAYLGDGDEISLGNTRLVFHGKAGGSPAASKKPAAPAAASAGKATSTKSGSAALKWTAGAVLLVAALLVLWQLL